MRPIERGPAPQEYTHYQDAKQDLVNRLGPYCSYCERRIATNLAVEHLAPKAKHPSLSNDWNNFLLACVNCNSAKQAKDCAFDQILLPDRDNTFAAFTYAEDGVVALAPNLPSPLAELAAATRELTALNRYEHDQWDETHLFSALERVGQRVQVWLQAQDARKDFELSNATQKRIAIEAASAGFFSIWMAAFEGLAQVRHAIIQAFPNTAADCFDDKAEAVSPRPDNGLPHAGKI